MRIDELELRTALPTVHFEEELHESLTTPELRLIARMFGHHHNPIMHDSPLWHPDFIEWEPVTPGILICYLRAESICEEWPSSLINHCRFLVEEQPDDLQDLARSCFYFWERHRRSSKVNWVDEGF